MRKFFKNRKGFTLIELIVVIAILAILAAIAIPRLSGFRETANVRADESNAKLLTNIANIYYAENDAFPWTDGQTFSSVTAATYPEFLSEDISILSGAYTYWQHTNGLVVAQ